MTAICQNANTFLTSARGSARSPRKAFGYDFVSARATAHRKEVCPSSGNGAWRDHHACPGVAADGNLAQPSVFRNDGLPWYTTAVEANLPYNAGRVLRHRRGSSGQITELSGVKYTCDEFPPATFIQGGAGTGRRLMTLRHDVRGFGAQGMMVEELQSRIGRPNPTAS